jgi:Rhodopirellula transposase DDE domain
VVQDKTAGNPMDADVIWTDLTAADVAEFLAKAGTPVSPYIVEQLFELTGYGRRQAQKSYAMGEHPDRNAQFLKIAELKQEYLDSLNPLLSIDTKKKELLGNYYRDGKLFTRQMISTFDHDFPSFADGVVIPHGLYDLKLNRGYLHLGTSRDTSEFACDALEDWWRRFGQTLYPQATSLLLLCDGGGSNSSRSNVFKEDLQELVNRIGLPVRVAHYPPYTSKYNAIEHRLFPHVTRACQGVIFKNLALVKQLMEKTQTRTGLSVVVDILDRIYETGRKVANGVKKTWNILRDAILPLWNYQMFPGRRENS